MLSRVFERGALDVNYLGKGKLTIHFSSLEELDPFIDFLRSEVYGESEMSERSLDSMIEFGEGLKIEFKEHFSSKIDRDMVAFANTCGGKILLGVNDLGQVVGEEMTNDLKARINDLARNCDPSIEVESIDLLDGVVVITIEESSNKPRACSSGYFKRLDAATQKMSRSELWKLFKKTDTGPRFEKQINEKVSWDNISEEKVRLFLRESKSNAQGFDVENILNSLDLAEGNKINNAGVLFFAKEPRRVINQCELILAAFKGTSGVKIYDRRYIQDDLLTQFNEAMVFIERHLNTRIEINGVNRSDICEIPLEALREAVINAIIHRDYSISGTNIMIEIHEDRVEIKTQEGCPKVLPWTQSVIRLSEETP